MGSLKGATKSIVTSSVWFLLLFWYSFRVVITVETMGLYLLDSTLALQTFLKPFFNKLYLLLSNLISVCEWVFIVNHPWGQVAAEGFVNGTETPGKVKTKVSFNSSAVSYCNGRKICVAELKHEAESLWRLNTQSPMEKPWQRWEHDVTPGSLDTEVMSDKVPAGPQ